MLVRYTRDTAQTPKHLVSLFIKNTSLERYAAPIAQQDVVFWRSFVRQLLAEDEATATGNASIFDQVAGGSVKTYDAGGKQVAPISESVLKPNPDKDAFRLSIYEMDDKLASVDQAVRDSLVMDGPDAARNMSDQRAYDAMLCAHLVCRFVVEPGR